jgi:hypothetical protein
MTCKSSITVERDGLGLVDITTDGLHFRLTCWSEFDEVSWADFDELSARSSTPAHWQAVE